MTYYQMQALAPKLSYKVNPSYDPELVKKKKKEIIDFLKQNQAEIEAGRLIVFFVNECRLLGDDVCGYVWGKRDTRIEIPIKNTKKRQTYFGALNYHTKKFIIREYPAGNSENTVKFIKDLRKEYRETRIALIWDGASYHKSDEVKDFLAAVNNNYEPTEWQITCIVFAPNAPEQNPVEDIWLQTKNFLRKCWHLEQIVFCR
ncbi:IS630 family transposase [Trichocoleus sp. FACHB-90]|uniref:IS630 family transposase n=1 Tax=Cyanophyceae TaxID=3028117 RepID=UPI00168668B4|nr:IS630 family transposase [Trichocoleus sp. FACHB-90]MBD1928711.1 IS630 family transposase [Trichocoleus sp. FACHB-90]